MRLLFAVPVLISTLGALAPAFGASVTFEAESAALGADFAVSNTATPVSITITSNGAGSNPGSPTRVATYNITFPAAGTYQLYARVRVGPNTFNDDSLFYASSFGNKNAALNSDWILVNNLASAGFNNSSDIVTGGGTLGSSVWKWINLSQFTGQTGFTVASGALTQTFQIGAREDGLDLDTFVFGTAGYTFTVADLDSGAPGTPGTSPAEQVIALPPDIVAGNLIQFNDNGNWTWYCDERSVIDRLGGKLIVGSDASGSGMNGPTRVGDVETVIYDLATTTWQRHTLKDGASDPGALRRRP